MKKLCTILICLAMAVCLFLLPVHAATADQTTFGVTWSEAPVYTGSKLKPTPVVTYGNELLELNTDYVLSYSNNTNAGNKAKVVITGKGDYAGISKTAYFSILPAEIADNVTVEASSATYIGAPVSPQTVTVTNKNGTALVEGVDYQVIYLNNVKVGKGTARIIGMGNYTGYYDATFDITELTDSGSSSLTFNIDIAESYYDEQQFFTNSDYIYFTKSADTEIVSLYVDNRYIYFSNSSTSYMTMLSPGEQTITCSYRTVYYTTSWKYVNGVMMQVREKNTTYHSASWTVIRINDTPYAPVSLVADAPIFQGADKIYLSVTGLDENGAANADVGDPVWASSNTKVASVEDGIVTLHKVGKATITATVGTLKAEWQTDDLAALTLSKNSKILSYDPKTEKATVLWKNELLTEGKDYTLSITKNKNMVTVQAKGINSYCDTVGAAFYADTGYSFVPYFTAQPTNKTGIIGNKKSFTVAAKGSGLQYQWQYRKSADGSWKNASATGNKTEQLTVSITKAHDGYQYRCVITDIAGNKAISQVATLSAWGVHTQPSGKAVKSGATAKFTVGAQGTGLKYQWQYRDSSKGIWKNTSATGNKTKTLSVAATTAKHGYQYRCKITNSAGSITYSDAVTLNVLGIKTQPAGKNVKDGATAKFTVTATGKGLKYQWQYRTSSSGSWKNTSATGNKTKTLSVAATTAKHGYQYRCRITDSAGNKVFTKEVSLKVLGIKTQPKNTHANINKTAKVTVTATGTGLTYRWYVKDTDDSKYSKTSCTTRTYTCKMTKANDGRKVYCVVTDKYGKTVKTNIVTLQAVVPPAISKQPVTTYAKNGKTAKITVKATGEGLTYRWYIKDTGDSEYRKTSVTKATYSCTMSPSVSGRRAYCVVKDKYGNTVRSTTVMLRMTLQITQQPQGSKTKENATATVNITALGDKVSYKWYYKTSGKSKYTLDKSNTDSSYAVTMTKARDGMKVYCVVTDKYGKSVKSNVVTLSAILNHIAGSNGKCTRCGKEMDVSDVLSAPMDSLAELQTFVPQYYSRECYYVGNYRLMFNSANGVILSWGATNTSHQTIKYLTFTVKYYNRVGDPARDSITGKNETTVKIIGPIEPGKSFYMRDLIGYSDDAYYAVITNVKIQYMDGGELTGWYGYKTWHNIRTGASPAECFIVED